MGHKFSGVYVCITEVSVKLVIAKNPKSRAMGKNPNPPVIAPPLWGMGVSPNPCAAAAMR